MKAWWIAGSALALAAGATCAVAQEEKEERVVFVGGPGGALGPDANKDGVVTREEFTARHAELFDRLDKNKDGRLTGDEFGPRGGPHRIEICKKKEPGDKEPKDVPCEGLKDGHGGGDVMIFRHGGHGGPGHGGPGVRRMMLRGGEGLDANKDGKLSLEEMQAPLKAHFTELDKNKDGFLDASEREGAREMIVERIEKRREARREQR